MPLSLIKRDKGIFLAFPWGKVDFKLPVYRQFERRMRVVLIPSLTASLLQCGERKMAVRVPHQSKIRDF